MRYWLRKQLIKSGLIPSISRREEAHNYRKLEFGETEKITFPSGIKKENDLRISKWFYENDEIVPPGKKIVRIENEEISLELETFVGGKLKQIKKIGQKVESQSILAEISGTIINSKQSQKFRIK